MTYLQEIVICPTIFEKISRFFSEESEEDIDLAAYNKNLRLKRFVKDMNAKGYSFIEEMIKEIYNKTSSIGKKKMDVILKSILISDRIVVKNIENIENFTKDKTRNHIFNLAKLSESKIVNSEDEILKLENKIIDVLNDIEVLDFDEFIDPPSESRIFALKGIYVLREVKSSNLKTY